ncbi:hypothetical protein N0B44_11860 [Roseibacterium beibuensis]|uniref:Uncharacterized protein n=1 Tax=[Roseibacterium] beibuensis TaxID=1193142 RepID=A0ABP9LEP8_9RHOB|nr:hypothetical protein [Roseibacterium beibuensis]MCS6623611.1 hypothetical protein [Roseibacterium beibuensis]
MAFDPGRRLVIIGGAIFVPRVMRGVATHLFDVHRLATASADDVALRGAREVDYGRLLDVPVGDTVQLVMDVTGADTPPDRAGPGDKRARPGP